MSTTRPLPKTVLQRMFLKTLHEHKNRNGKYTANSSGVDNILASTLPNHFGLGRLTEEEVALARRGVFELERDGYLVEDPTQQSDNFKVLSDKGLSLVEQELEDMRISSVDIGSLLTNEILLHKVRDDFIAGEYETAIIKAFKMVEEGVRKKAGLGPNDHGRDLLTKAFNSKNAILKHPEAKTPAEAESLFFLMVGGYGWYRNPASHRTVQYANDQQAAQILGFANLLLDMNDQCSV